MVNVEEYSNNDLLNLFYRHGECGRIVRRTCRLFNERYPDLPTMTPEKFGRIETRFIATGNVRATQNNLKPVTDNEDNMVNVLAFFKLIRGNIKKKHGMHPFSEITVHGLRLGDEARRVNFCEFMILKMIEGPGFLHQIMWTDESKFSRQGITNRQNTHYWAQDNPHVIREHNHQDRFSFNVFCLIMDNTVAYQV
ncbi:transposable element tc3 transposase-like protein [Holotrichia oblita]|uniref:Transposable element tc3 transposase-like protein n=1 Tax=Holotrichia oblita TaxID=644536 RepID=A0ACB9T079_HOLOL|nr:transposable element tc3 transposase-like protein [Holotrichia oblita]